MYYIVKVISFQDHNDNKLYTYHLDIDTAMDTNNGTILVVNYSLKKIDSNNYIIVLHGYATDARGGSVGISLIKEFQKVN